MAYSVVLFSGPASTSSQARHVIEQDGFTIGARSDSHGLPDYTDDVARAAAGDVPVSWLEVVETERLPDEGLLYRDLEPLGWRLRMHETPSKVAEQVSDPLSMLEERFSAQQAQIDALTALLTGATGHPDPGSIQAAAQTPPYAIQASSHTAELFRRASFFATVPSRGGSRQGADLLVSQHGGGNMSVDVASGEILIPGSSTTSQGLYYGFNDATVNLVISASNPTNPRIDVPCATVDDAQYAGGANDWKLQVITGTPAVSPAVPALPVSSISLANVAVAALAATILTANITVPVIRASALGGVIICTSTTRPTTGLFAGLMIYETDTNSLKQYTTGTTLWTPPWNEPWGLQGYAELTSNSAGFTTLVDSGLGTVSLPASWPANRRVRVLCYSTFQASGSAAQVDNYVREGSSAIAMATETIAASGQASTIIAERIIIPASGAHTYKQSVEANANTIIIASGTPSGATTPGPTFISIEDLGPSANPT
jgi:hypothetical protein